MVKKVKLKPIETDESFVKVGRIWDDFRAICVQENVTMAQIRCARTGGQLGRARREVIRYLHVRGYTYAAIGRVICRDSSTVRTSLGVKKRPVPIVAVVRATNRLILNLLPDMLENNGRLQLAVLQELTTMGYTLEDAENALQRFIYTGERLPQEEQTK